ncbi:hypothetical protein HPB47_019069 [Ixodes persulcatus]|uniref:Uncharacterized protein n=1 Tax=Ixodes persulcatus TaxID=34615 RepID=A0AC60QJ46_IXOPE|nr:hypothetical protein HPB47_019069 [Ixodes persulcatus]
MDAVHNGIRLWTEWWEVHCKQRGRVVKNKGETGKANAGASWNLQWSANQVLALVQVDGIKGRSIDGSSGNATTLGKCQARLLSGNAPTDLVTKPKRGKLTAVKPKAVMGAQDKCFRCGSPKHTASSCPHRNAICYRCNPSLANTPGRANQFRNFSAEEEKSEAIYGLQDRNMNAPFYYTLKMELDTGAAVSIISKRQFQSLFPRAELSPASLILRTYTGERVKPKGVATVDVEYRDFKGKLPLHVLGEDGPPLIGRDWSTSSSLTWDR